MPLNPKVKQANSIMNVTTMENDFNVKADPINGKFAEQKYLKKKRYSVTATQCGTNIFDHEC